MMIAIDWFPSIYYLVNCFTQNVWFSVPDFLACGDLRRISYILYRLSQCFRNRISVSLIKGWSSPTNDQIG